MTNRELLARIFPRLVHRLHVVASNFDWLIALFVSVVILHSCYLALFTLYHLNFQGKVKVHTTGLQPDSEYITIEITNKTTRYFTEHSY